MGIVMRLVISQKVESVTSTDHGVNLQRQAAAEYLALSLLG